MPEFRYTVIDPKGRERSGQLTAANDDAARTVLTTRKLHIVSVQETAADARPRRALLSRGGGALAAKDLAMVTRQLATLTEVTPLEEALRTISRQSEAEKTRRIIGSVHGGLVEGRRLADSMAREPKSFPPLYRAMVAAGESTGALPEILTRLAALQERQAEVRGKLIATLAYPVVLAVVATLVVGALMIFVVPKVVEQFNDVGQQLPLLTRIVIGLSAFLASYWWVMAIAATIGALIFARALKIPSFRLAVDGALLRLPLLGKLIRDLNAARLARTLATMVASRLPLLEGLRLTQPTVRNSVLSAATGGLIDQVRAGGSLSGAMRSAGVFPPLLVYLTASGESAGQLDTMLERAASYLEREFDRFTATSMALLEPLIIVIMGSLVALIVLSILLPILQLQNLAGI